MNGHPGRVTTRGRDPTGGVFGGPGQSAAWPVAPSQGDGAAKQPNPPLRARRDDPAAGATRVHSREQGDSRCHHSSRPDAAPHNPARPRMSKPTTVAPHRSRAGCGGQDCLRKRPPARQTAGGSGRGRSPPPRRLAHLFLRLLLLLLPQPPPPQPPEASLPLQQAHLFRIAPQPGAEGPPLVMKGRGVRMEAPPTPVPCRGPAPVGCRSPTRAMTFTSARVSPKPQLQIPTLGIPGEGGSNLPGPPLQFTNPPCGRQGGTLRKGFGGWY